uniref:Uncharacterized protein n=1 Tax=Candidatus Kentrum sp. FM TaxID=2126340 RepID=A0A450TFS6_9GAMM|nr:MAG: hypothetical protein BECKFM1743A_GA0114220_103984 [Candidatus Kentron sp. FM]VFK19985.1 MAG: hypothetical protein BECKFM1743B_GA0114221_106602 [Candidatus Kentron sp. FM]
MLCQAGAIPGIPDRRVGDVVLQVMKPGSEKAAVGTMPFVGVLLWLFLARRPETQ